MAAAILVASRGFEMGITAPEISASREALPVMEGANC
jgi:hypothetical protein